MEKFSIYFLAGFCGGIVRGLVGFIKNKTMEKAHHFKPSYFLITILISGIVGASAGILADTEWQVSFLAGYAGTDFIENLYKIRIGKKLAIPYLYQVVKTTGVDLFDSGVRVISADKFLTGLI